MIKRLTGIARADLWVALLCGAFAWVLLVPYLNGHWKLADDAYYGTLPQALLQARILQEGMWPFWNPNAGVGHAWGISSGAGVFNPFQIVWGLLIGWSEKSYLWYLFLHLSAGGILAARFASRAGLSVQGALFFAFAFVGCGLNVGFFSNIVLFSPYLFWPLLGSGLLQLHQEPDRVRAGSLKIGIAVALMELTGYPLSRIIIYGATGLTYWLMTRKPGTWFVGGKWRPIFMAGAAAMLIALPQTITQVESLKDSHRTASGIYDDSVYHNVANPMMLGSMIFPAQFMARNQFQLGSMHLERSWWVGWMTLAILFGAFFRGALSLRRFAIPAVISFFSMLFSFGAHSFFRETMSVLVPILGSLRHSHLGRMPINLLLCFVAAVALDALLQTRDRPSPTLAQNRSLTRYWVAFIGLCAVVALSEADHAQLAKALYFDTQSGWKMSLLHMSFYLLLAVTAYIKRSALPKPFSWAHALVALQFLSLADVGYSFRYWIGERRDAPIKVVDQDFRVLSPQPNEREVKNWFDGDGWYTWEGNRKILNAYDPPGHKLEPVVKADPRTAPLLNKLASCQSDPVATLGRASDVAYSCEGLGFQIDYHFGNRIELSGSGPSPALMVVHDLIDPRWRATLNDRPVPILTAFGYFKGVDVPPGAWKLKLEYVHPLFPALWLAPVLGIVLLVFGPGFFLRASPRTIARPGKR